MIAPDGTKTLQDFDPLGRVTFTYTKNSGDTLLAQTQNIYSGPSLASTNVYGVVGGTPSTTTLATSYAYDAYGRAVKVTQPAGAFTKTTYNRANQVVGTYLGTDEGSDSTTMTDDVIVEQTVTSYDTASGLPLLTTKYQRNHDTLDSVKGDLALTTGSARVAYAVRWYDAQARPTMSADYGTNNGTAITINALPAAPTLPNASTGSIATAYTYDGYGRPDTATDNNGIVTKTCYDSQSRRTYMIENFQPGSTYWAQNNSADDYSSPLNRDVAVNRVTQYTYTTLGQLATICAIDPNANGNSPVNNNQTTTYTYSDDTNTGGCPVSRHDLLIKVQYPDGNNSSDNVQFTYYANVAMATRTDQRGVVITYSFDDVGRQNMQNVTLPTSTEVDNSVLAVGFVYDDSGRMTKATNFSQTITDPTSTSNIVNQVVNTYDGYGMLIEQQQDPQGVVGTNSPAVVYTYDSSLRPASVTYPKPTSTTNGRNLFYYYGASGSITDRLGLLAGIAPDNGSGQIDTNLNNLIVSYTYIGAGTVAIKDYPVPQVKLDYFDTYDSANGLHNTSGTYAGLDNFGRVQRQMWVGYNGSAKPVFDIKHGYDASSNRLYADNQVYTGASQYYSYDSLNRLTSAKTGELAHDQSSPPLATGPASTWQNRRQDWQLDQVGNQTGVKDFGQDFTQNSFWYTGTFNKANEFSDDSGVTVNRTVRGDTAKQKLYYDSFDSDTTTSLYAKQNSNDVFAVNSPAGKASFTTIDPNTTPAVVTLGETLGSVSARVAVTLPTGIPSGYAGIVYGYKNAQVYSMYVLEWDGTTAYKRCYHVSNGEMDDPLSEEVLSTYTLGSTVTLDCSSNGISGKVGLVAGVAGATFDSLSIWDDADSVDMLGRWMQFGSDSKIANVGGTNYLDLSGTAQLPALLKGVRTGGVTDKFQVTFSNKLDTGHDNEYAQFVFNAKDVHTYNMVRVYLGTTQTAPQACFSNGYPATQTQTNSNVPSVSVGGTLWTRIEYNGTTLTARCIANNTEPQESDWNDTNAPICMSCSSTSGLPMDGGYIGFAGGSRYIGKVTVKTDKVTGGSGWVTELVETFANNSGAGEEKYVHDAAGNLTYDGLDKYYYDAWNRLAKVSRAYRDSNGALQVGSQIAAMGYDAFGRRVVKDIDNSGDWDCKYMYTFDGQRKIEKRNASGWVLEQYVWGGRYVDELVQIGLNQDPAHAVSSLHASENVCERFFWVMQDVNYNVLGVTSAGGCLTERYEYSPYGQRKIFTNGGWLPADTNDDGKVGPADLALVITKLAPAGLTTDTRADVNGDGCVGPADQAIVIKEWNPAGSLELLLWQPSLDSTHGFGAGTGLALQHLADGLCDFGHQGLEMDKEYGGGVYENRARMYNSTMARMMQTDPLGTPLEPPMAGDMTRPKNPTHIPGGQFKDGMSGYQYVGSDPVSNCDPNGTKIFTKDDDDTRKTTQDIFGVLSNGAKWSKCQDGKYYLEVTATGTTAANLVKELVGSSAEMEIAKSSTNEWTGTTVHFVASETGDGISGWYIKRGDPDAIAELKNRRTTVKEYSISLAHELIHAYYGGIVKHRFIPGQYGYTEMVIMNQRTSDGGTRKTVVKFPIGKGHDAWLKTEEMLTLGYTNVKSYDAEKKKVYVRDYSGSDYTEWKVAESIKTDWIRIAYSNDIPEDVVTVSIKNGAGTTTTYLNDDNISVETTDREKEWASLPKDPPKKKRH